MIFKQSSICAFPILLMLFAQLPAFGQDNRVEPTVPQVTTPLSASTPKADVKLVRISAGDLVDISVFGLPEIGRVTRVSSGGEVSLPLIGSLQIGNLTTEEAQVKIAREFEAQNYLRSPQVTVFVKEYATQGISVLGEVTRPGMYPLFGQVRLLDAVSAAGGLTQRAGRRISITHRNSTDPANVVQIDSASDISNVELLPGDTVIVAKAGVVYVVGNVEKPGGFVMDNNEKLTVLQAIALAQGVNRTAALDKAVLIRSSSSGREEIPIPLKKILASQSPDLPLAAEDIIFVPNSAGKNAAKRTMDAVLATLPGLAIYAGR